MIFGIWLALGIAAGAWLLSRLFAPEVEDIEREDPVFDLPREEEGAPLPIVYGRARLRNPQVMYWSADFALLRRPDATIVKVGDVNQFYLHGTLALHCGLLVDNHDINRIFYDDNRVWQGFAKTASAESDESRILREFTGFKGSADSEHGTWLNPLGYSENLGKLGRHMKSSGFGRVRWYPGSFTQGLNARMDAEISDPVPNFRGHSYLIFEDCWLAEGGRMPAVHIEVVGYPDALSLTGDNHEISNHANPIEVIYDLLTNPWGRLGMSASLINTASFQAAGNTIADEGNGISAIIDKPTSVRDAIAEILRHIDGLLYFDPFDGQLHIGLVREDYTVGSLTEFTDTDMDISKAVRERTTWQDALDQMRVTYEARSSYSRATQAIVQNMATYYGKTPTNRVRSADLKYKFIKSWGPIGKIAARELLAGSTPVTRAVLPVSRKGIDLRPNMLFRWSSALYGFTDRVMRVADIDYGGETDAPVVVTCFEDRFALDRQVMSDPVEVTVVTLVSPAESTVKQTIEAPQWMMYRAEVEGLAADRDDVRMFYLARPAGTVETAFAPQVSEDGGTIYVQDGRGTRPFAQYAKVQQSYARTDEPYDTSVFPRLKGLSDPNILQNRTPAQIRLGSNLVLIKTAAGDEEIVAYENFDELAISAAAEVWIYDASADSYTSETTDFNSTTDADWSPMVVSEAVGDWFAVGFADKFSKIRFDGANGTAGVGGAGVWEYLNTSNEWVALSGVTDGTSGFTAGPSDNQLLTFTAPTDWAKTIINGGSSLYFVRFRITTVYSTNPVYDQGIVGGVYRLKNVWRGELDTSAIDWAADDEAWFLDDGAIWLECLGGRGFDGDEAMKIKLATFVGPIGSDWESFAAEDLQLAQRSLLPYPVDKLTIGQAPALYGDASAVNEYPGSPIVGLADNWVVAPELVALFNRRYRKQESIRRGDDADEDPDETPLGPSFGATTYDMDVDVDGGGYVNIGNDSDDLTAHSLDLVSFGDGSPDGLVRIRTKRADPAGDRFSFTAPVVKAHIAEFRQIVVNPSFDEADGRGWSTVSGTPAYVASGSLTFAGKHLRSSSGTSEIEQVRKVQSMSGKTLRVRWRGRDFGGGATSVRLRVITEKDDGTDLDTYDSGTVTVSQNYWDYFTAEITGINSLATQIRIIATVTESGVSGQDGAIDGIEVYVCGDIDESLVAEPGMNSGLGSWNKTNMAAASTSVRTESPSFADGGASTGTCQMYQDTGVLPGGFASGDVAHLRCLVRTGTDGHTVNVTLESRDSGSGVLRTATTGAVTFDGDTDWHWIDLFMVIPNSHNHFRVQFDGDGGASAPDVQFDSARLALHAVSAALS